MTGRWAVVNEEQIQDANKRIVNALAELVDAIDTGDEAARMAISRVAVQCAKQRTLSGFDQFHAEMRRLSLKATSMSLLMTGDLCFSFDDDGSIRYFHKDFQEQ